jgi:E3 ubiquitin-protein ligase MYCBP2
MEDILLAKTEELPNRFAGWVTLWIKDWRHSLFKIGFRGPDNAVRVRQIRLIGERLSDGHGGASWGGDSWNFWRSPDEGCSQLDAALIKQNICEVETLRVFRQLVSQVTAWPSHIHFPRFFYGNLEPLFS